MLAEFAMMVIARCSLMLKGNGFRNLPIRPFRGMIRDMASPSKKAKTDATHERNEEARGSPGPSVPRQRVTAKGANVPAAIESFHDLKSRFDLSLHLLANLEKSGFEYPTGIQAHGIPILMEVRFISPDDANSSY